MAQRAPLTDPLVEEASTPWAKALERLEAPEPERTYWLATVHPDGRPHLRPLLGLWLDGSFFFVTGARTRKGRNLADEPRCVVAASSQTLPALDIIIEGTAVKVTDEGRLRRVVDAYATVMQWPLTVQDGAVVGPNAPTAGPPPYAVYEVRPAAILGLPGIAGTEGGETPGAFSPTRWRF
jgi:Pyridoxamine 5'-phosphate oxidase